MGVFPGLGNVEHGLISPLSFLSSFVLTYAFLRVIWIDFEVLVAGAPVPPGDVHAVVHAVAGWVALIDVYQRKTNRENFFIRPG